MAKVTIISGKKESGKYRAITAKNAVGKTVVAVGVSTTEGNCGPEPTTVLYFSDKSKCEFVHPTDD